MLRFAYALLVSFPCWWLVRRCLSRFLESLLRHFSTQRMVQVSATNNHIRGESLPFPVFALLKTWNSDSQTYTHVWVLSVLFRFFFRKHIKFVGLFSSDFNFGHSFEIHQCVGGVVLVVMSFKLGTSHCILSSCVCSHE